VRLSEHDWTKQISEQIADGNGEPDIRHTLRVALCHGTAILRYAKLSTGEPLVTGRIERNKVVAASDGNCFIQRVGRSG